MGLLLKGDFETEIGQANEIYIRIEGFNFRKADMSLFTPVSLWASPTSRHQLINTVIFYDQTTQTEQQVEIPVNYQVSLTDTILVSEPLFELKEVEEEVPYISFDEEGEEITKYRKVMVEKKVQVGEEDVEREVDNISLIQQDIFKTIYNHIEKELLKLFPTCTVTHT